MNNAVRHSPFSEQQQKIRQKHCHQNSCRYCWSWPSCGSQELWPGHPGHGCSSKFSFILPSHSKLEIANVYAECHRDERSRKWLRPTKAVQFGRALQSNSEAASIWGDGVESIKVLYSSIICCPFLNTRGMPWIWASKLCDDIQYKLWYHYVHKNLQNLFSSTDTYEFITKKSYWFSRSTARVQLPSIAKRPKVKAMLC